MLDLISFCFYSKGKNLVASGKEDLIQFVITVGGQVCNITSKQKVVVYNSHYLDNVLQRFKFLLKASVAQV